MKVSETQMNPLFSSDHLRKLDEDLEILRKKVGSSSKEDLILTALRITYSVASVIRSGGKVILFDKEGNPTHKLTL